TADNWGPARIMSHLIDVEKLYRGRMQLILTQETPYLKSANPAADGDDSAHVFRPELEAFAMERGETISLLMNLALKQWERTGIHDEYGELSVEDIAERLIDHDNEHLAQIEAAFQQ
ncbi:MAG TPA: DinB family protein, partial [Nitrolancea sp.]|nr:DinB family protein [Nitrolancea sp.]